MNEKEFEKQQLEQLLNDLKDIDKYTSFKNGAFIYDLGKYQGSLLVNHIHNLQFKIDKAIEYIEKYLEEHIIEDQPDEQSIFYDEKGRYIPNAKEQLLSILKGDK